jgi:hypothetical protein
MTQAGRVLDWLQNRGDLDPMTAWNELGIYRLGARIFDLRKEGHAIERRMKDVSNRFGETCHVACYSLGE